jgi:hypothetical protein
VHRVAELHLDVVSLAGHPHVGLPELAQQKQRRPRLLPQRHPQRVVLTPLPHRLLHVVRHPVETVRGARPFDPSVRALMIVIAHPVSDPLARVRERREVRFGEKLLPDRPPESLDLA